jgi:hypothetical protein
MLGCESRETVFASRSNRRADFRRGREVRRQDLDRDRAVEARVLRAIDLPHPAAPSAERTSQGPRREPGVSGMETGDSGRDSLSPTGRGSA